MDTIPRLPDEHLAKARELASAQRSGKNCKLCYNRGYQGTDQNNMLVLCPKCVDGETVSKQWRDYVNGTPELAELYGDYFDVEEEEGDGEEDSSQTDRRPGPEPRHRSEAKQHTNAKPRPDAKRPEVQRRADGT